MLFSATQTRKTEDLARVSLKKEPLYVGVDDVKDTATVEGLEQVCYPLSCLGGVVAQLVEHLPTDPLVVGSTPLVSTMCP